MQPYTTIDEYISNFSPETQQILEKMRKIIKRVAPEVTEAISYGVPTFKLDGKYLIYIAAFKKHISVYPAPRGAEEFKKELEQYKGGKGTVQFPLNQPIPYDLVERITKFRKAERQNLQ